MQNENDARSEKNGRIIDMHTHAFPPQLARGAIPMMEKISGYEAQSNGTFEDLRAKEAAWGVDAFTILHIATKPGQYSKVNAFAESCLAENVFCFGSMHPEDTAFDAELATFRERGLSGVKLHADYQGFFADDPAAFRLYEAVAKAGLPLYLHCGFDPKSPDVYHTTPKMVASIAATFPEMRILGAHLGGMYCFEEIAGTLGPYANITVDISMMAGNIDEEVYRSTITSLGASRVVFGSDCPWSQPSQQLEALQKLQLPEADMQKILCQNAEAILGIA